MVVEKFQKILLDVWREACRHIQIGESADTFFRMLREQMPLAGVVIHWVDVEHQRVSIATAVPKSAAAVVQASEVNFGRGSELSEKHFRQLTQWVRNGELTRVDESLRKSSPLVGLLQPEADQSLLVAPLQGPNGTLGLFTLIPERHHQLNDRHEDTLRALLEPLGVALENDRRVHELAILREAAEADRRSLLTRLGRKEMIDTVIGSDTGLKGVLRRVSLCSRSLVPVLILGETGTGKEVIAREIHNGSGRSSGPFIRVNCGAIPPDLIDSQLFGHEKGSFTGAVEARQGWFERADGGTLFLDEIGELPQDAQVRFLRVLQDGFVERVGSHRMIQVDVRVVAATHRNLADMVAEGTFREDLWYRIAVFPIIIPPLRERLEDILPLVEHFVGKATTRFGLPIVHASIEDIQLLSSYHWPGNIRELGAVIDRAVILGEGKSLEIRAAMGISESAGFRESRPVAVLPGKASASQITAAQNSAGEATAGIGPSAVAASALPLSTGESHGILPSLDEAMRKQIEIALEATRGRIEGLNGAAAVLKINPHTLRARMRKLGIDWARFRAPRVEST
ncbi:MAG: sigma-54-dependent Fis family transcriptional regulator [Planctomyces sp.]|nr:sigma-54-dependent Fis family transcriptional regulator [Planctomyces sp.]